MIIARRNFLAALVGGTAASYWSAATAQQRPSLVEPVYRIATAPASATPAPLVQTPPLEIALQMARDGLNHSINQINDYTATLVKR
ncbi:MAG: hypothetical protein EHM42_13855, partial [Planctomycetaceae bacterium]